jgi:hypothetical protein
LIVIKAAYFMRYKMRKEGVIVKALLDGHVLDVHCFFSKMTMVTNSETIMKGDCLMNHVTRLWQDQFIFHLQAQVFEIHKAY